MSIAFLILSVLASQNRTGEVSKALHAEYRRTIDSEQSELKALAKRLELAGKQPEAERVRETIESDPPPGKLRFRPFPEVISAQKASPLPDEARTLRSKNAKTLFSLATKALTPPVRRIALADLCLREVLERDPDNAEARRLMGFLPYGKGWATPHAVQLIKSGHVLHAKFGWVPGDWVEHLDAGELPGDFTASGKPLNWLPAIQADELRREWDHPWTIETAPHFVVQTNVKLAEGVAFASRLEAFHQLFMAQFADVIGPEYHPLVKRFDSKKQQPIATDKRFSVAYFAEKSEYVDILKATFGKDERISLGIYIPFKEARRVNKGPRSFFYKDTSNPIASHATLYHEGSHQIFFETALNSKFDSSKTNFWTWEGLATYFETVDLQEDGSILIGGFVGPRIDLARQNAVKNYVPLAKFVAMDEDKFYRDKNDEVYRNYAQAMALADFLLHGEGGQYREGFLDFVAEAYRGKVKSTSLTDRLGVPFAKLDEQFRAYLK